MTKIALILGPTGKFSRHAAQAFRAAGWTVRPFDRRSGDLMAAARDVDVIVNGWNPPYHRWAAEVPGLHARVRAAAGVNDATVILPGNVYVFGPDAPERFAADTPHRATNPLGRIRREMEAAYRNEGTRTILLRAGDFIDTEASGNWFDSVMVRGIGKGRFTCPGAPEARHAWAYLPDMARAAVALAERRDALPRFADVPFPGYTLTGHEMAVALARATGRPVRLKRLTWWPLRLLQPVMPYVGGMFEMRYLWSKPHFLDGTEFDRLLPGFRHTPVEAALASALPVPARHGSGQTVAA